MQSVEVSWPLDATTVYGTLVTPAGPPPHPCVVLVAGSGPTDRDWNSPLIPGTNGSARLLAEALAGAGFASVRYDKRGIGPHGPEALQVMAGRMSMQGFADEVAGAVRLAADRAGGFVFVLGNSEGTLHALNYQLGHPANPVAGLVLVGPPGRSVGAVAHAQLAAQAAAFPNGEALLALYDAAIARFQAGEPMNPDPALPESVQQLLRAIEAPVNQPFSRELWLADAASLLRRVDVPALVVIGRKDIQVDWRADGEPLQRAAAGHPDVSFLFPEDCNHVLKHEPRPRAELTAANALPNYNAADARLDPQALTGILDWLAAHVRSERPLT